MFLLLIAASVLLAATPSQCKLTGAIDDLSIALQNVPRYNFSFNPVPPEFGADEQYAQSLAMTALPFAIILALSGAVLVPCWCAYLMCCGGGRRARSSRGSAASNAALVGTLYVSLLLVVVAVVCGYVANAALHRDVDATVVILNDTATRFETDLQSLNATLDALDPTLSRTFASQINETVFKADRSIEAVKQALADIDEYEEYRLIAIHASLVPAALSAVGGIGLAKFAAYSSVAWSLIGVASWISSLLQTANSGAHFAVSVAASDLCRLADNATDSGSISLLPEPERVAVQVILHCNDTRELDPLLLALNQSIVGFNAALDAARNQMPENNTLVNWLVGRINLASSAVNIIEYIETCRSAKDAMKDLVPVMCDGAMVHSTYLWVVAGGMTILLLTSCCSATVRARRARARYDQFYDHDDFESMEESESRPFVRGATPSDSLDTYEREYGSIRTARSSARRSSSVWND
jgi:hypothetical protein